MHRSADSRWDLWIIQPVFPLCELEIIYWRDILEKTSPVGKIISKLGNGYDVETLDAIVPTLTAKAKL